MDRGIPVAGNEEIELYLRTYYSLLRSTGEIQVRSLVETHSAMKSSLHLGAEELKPDISAFVYAVMRLPPEIFQTRLVLSDSQTRSLAGVATPTWSGGNWCRRQLATGVVSSMGRRPWPCSSPACRTLTI